MRTKIYFSLLFIAAQAGVFMAGYLCGQARHPLPARIDVSLNLPLKAAK